MKEILIVEDDEILSRTLAHHLRADGWKVAEAQDCAAARALLRTAQYQLVLLDINLPDGSGLELCRELGEGEAEPYVIFLTANDRESDQLQGYEAGGADYVTKPFSVAVLQKKVAAVLRRERGEKGRDRYEDGRLSIHFSGLTASLDGAPVPFSPKEFRVLQVFTGSPGKLLTRRALLERLWDVEENYIDDHTLTTTVSAIRKKLEASGRQYIQTVYGMGYLWTGGEET